MTSVIIIPARLESTRLPRKLLLRETGKPLLRHVYEQALKSCADAVNVIGDCKAMTEEIAKFVPPGSYATSLIEHPNGTSRAAEAWEEMIADFRPDGGDMDTICILQGDVPEIAPALIDQVITELEQHLEWDCATAAVGDYRTDTVARASPSPHVVKVQVTEGDVEDDWEAHDFARNVQAFSAEDERGHVRAWHHIGIYAYRREALLKYAAAGPCQREQDESLEQLRALHIGLRMGVVLTDEAPAGIDTREDYDAFAERYKKTAV